MRCWFWFIIIRPPIFSEEPIKFISRVEGYKYGFIIRPLIVNLCIHYFCRPESAFPDTFLKSLSGSTSLLPCSLGSVFVSWRLEYQVCSLFSALYPPLFQPHKSELIRRKSLLIYIKWFTVRLLFQWALINVHTIVTSKV